VSPRQLVLASVVSAYLLGMGFLGGTIASAMRFDQRRAVILSQLEGDSARVRGTLMLLERDATRSAAIR
jgi:hypothetical protein